MSWTSVNIASGNGLMPDSTKSLSELMLTSCDKDPLRKTFQWNFIKNCHSRKCIWKWLSSAKCQPFCSGLSVLIVRIGSKLISSPVSATDDIFISTVEYKYDETETGFHTTGRYHSVYTPSQWETTLQCNVVSHWLGTCTEWFLYW